MASESERTFTIASRASKLAQIQTNSVLDSFHSLYPPSASTFPKFQTRFSTNEAADVDKSSAIYLMGGKALWTQGLEVSLIDKDVDILVHCLKDVPTILPEGCIIAGVLERENPVDALLINPRSTAKTISDLPSGSVIGTGSVRRVAQLQRQFPHLKFEGLRGNMYVPPAPGVQCLGLLTGHISDTRIAKLNAPDSPYSAIVLAKAGLLRANLAHHIAQDLTPPVLFHAVSQGALALEVRADDHQAIALCDSITHWQSKWCCWAERGMLRVLEGGCSVPVGTTSSLVENDGVKILKLLGTVTSLDGTKHVEHVLEEAVESLEAAEEVGKKLAGILIKTGAREILEEIERDKVSRIGELKGHSGVITQSQEHVAA